MGRHGVLWVCAALSAAGSFGCDDLDPCDVQGETKACTCTDGRDGAQMCLPERVFGDCECTGAVPVPDAGGEGGTGGGGTGGSSGTGAASGAGGTGGGVAPLDAGDDDAGDDPPVGGSGGTSGSGATGGTGGMGGTGGTTEPMSAAYRACTGSGMGDCATGAMCVSEPAGLGTPETSVCAPACTEVSNCPVPEGTYDADVVCTDMRCRIDCTGTGFPFPTPLSCPGGMACVTPAFSTTSYCYDDGV